MVSHSCPYNPCLQLASDSERGTPSLPYAYHFSPPLIKNQVFHLILYYLTKNCLSLLIYCLTDSRSIVNRVRTVIFTRATINCNESKNEEKVADTMIVARNKPIPRQRAAYQLCLSQSLDSANDYRVSEKVINKEVTNKYK